MCNSWRRALSVLTVFGVFFSILAIPSPASAGPAPVLTTYVPIPEDDVNAALVAMAATSGLTIGNQIQTTISITVSTANAVVYYDHWEDGFESDIANSVQASTEVWGDNDPSNGIPPGYSTDVFASGSVIILDNGGTIPTPRSAAAQAYDGRDKVASNRGFALTRAGWEATYGTLHAGAVAAFDTSKFGTAFSFPVGVNIASNEAFEYTALSVMASTDDTTVWIDTNGDGTTDSTSTIDEGETIFIDGGISAGGTLTANGPVQAFLITGDIGATFEGRWYELFPDALLSDSYIAAAGTTELGTEPAIFLNNPGSSAITVDITLSSGSTSVGVPAGSTVSYLMPNGSGARFSSPGNTFHALSATGGLSAANSSENDWGYTLVPDSLLTTGVLVGWGPGATDASNMSPVWVAATADTTIFVDYDGVSGNDTAIPVAAYESVPVYDSADFDMTGARIYTLDGTPITAAWGQDPNTASPGTPALDLGTAIIPATAMVVEKTASLVVDADTNGVISPGDTVQFQIYILDASALSLNSVNVVDELPAELIYVEGSTTLDGSVIADDGSGTPFPLDEGGHVVSAIGAGASVTFAFSTQILDPWPAFKTSVSNQAVASALEAAGSDSITVPVFVPALAVSKTADTPGPLAPGDSFNYQIEVSNTGNTAQQNVAIFDTLPPSVTLDSAALTSLVDGSSGFALDDLSAQTFSVNAGSLSWATAWAEVDGSGVGATAGDVRVAALSGEDRLALSNASTSATRDFDASSFDQLSLSVDVSRQGLDDTGDYVALQISDDGGSSWVELQRFTGPATDATFVSHTFDVSRFSGSTLSVRFSSSPSLGATDSVYFDNIGIQALERLQTTVSAGSEPTLASGLTLYPGETATVTIAATINGLVAGTTTISNTAIASSDTDGPDSSTVVIPVSTGSIGDTIFTDIDGDGVQDAGDLGIPGVSVTLFDGSGVPVEFATTDGTGQYAFDSLIDGAYSVTIDLRSLPASTVTPTTERDAVLDGTTVINLAVGEDVSDADFGFQPLGSIGDTVYADADGDGTQGSGEPGLGSVDVELVQGGVVVDTQTTNSGGIYAFGDLAAGTYTVRVVASTLPSTPHSPTTDRDSTADGLTVVVLGAGEDVIDADFGYQPLGSIGDTIFADVDGDGVQEPGDEGIAGVDVELVSGGGVVLATDTTDSSGVYGFSGLVPGDYTVRVDSGTLPATTQTQTADPDAALDDETSLTLAAGAAVLSADFGYQPLGTIGDTVFADVNGDGVQGAGDAGISGVTIELVQGGTTLGTLVTDSSGLYDFIDLPAGPYIVRVISGLPSGTTTQTGDRDSALDDQTSVILLPGATIGDADFGYQPLGGIGDTVFADVNGNGTQDVGDVGIAGVAVELVQSGTVLYSATTDASGNYLFGGIPAGAYLVRIASGLPANATTQTADADGSFDGQTVVVLAPAGTDLTADFGYQPLGSIGNTVFADVDGDGTQDSGDAGVAGVTVQLVEAGVVTGTAITDASGGYSFGSLPAGSYAVRVDTSSLPATTVMQTADRDASLDDETTVALAAGAVVADADFGYQPLGSIGDTIFADINGDGTQGSGETGIAGVTVELVQGGVVSAFDATDASGAYSFADLPAGTYTVRVDVSSLPTDVRTPTADRDGSLDSETAVFLAAGELVSDADFGYQPRGSIGDTVFADVDGSGTQSSGEPGIPAVTVELVQSGTVLATTVTNSFGTYSFGSLPAGSYTVRVDVSSLPSTTTAQTADPDASMDAQTGVLLPPSGAVDTADFGFQPLGALGDTVFADIDGDGTQDAGDPGLPDVTLELVESGVVTDTTVTDASGAYNFAGLPTGPYTIRVDVTSLPTTTTTPTADRDGSLDDQTTLTLAAGATIDDADFGYQPLGSIGDRVFADVNGDGVQGSGDGGIAGVTVELLDGGTVLSTTTTDATGSYNFINLAAGSYNVRVLPGSLPASTTTPTADRDSTVDSQTAITLLPGAHVDDADFGYQPLGSIGDTVFSDLNGDGTQDSGEAGILGVQVELVVAGLVADTALTDASGMYGFAELPAGPYDVRVEATSLPSLTTTQTADRDATLDNQTSIALTAGEVVGDADFGFQPLGELGDTVFADVNGDGVQSAGDAGISGAAVLLLDGAGLQLASATTDSAGTYSFAALPVGTYTVQIDERSLPTSTVTPTGDRDTTIDSQTTVELLPGQIIDDADFGYQPLGTVGDTVFADVGGDGIQNIGDDGIGAVSVELIQAGVAVASTTTDVNGRYTFSDLAAGTYGVRVLVGSLPSSTTTQTADPDAVLDSQTTIVLSAGGIVTDADFGFQPLGSIGDTIFADVNGDGTQDLGDAGLAGVLVRLLDGSGAQLSTTLTDVSGQYTFSSLAPANYSVTIDSSTLPVGVSTPTGDPDGVLDSMTALTLASGQAITDADFGYQSLGSIGDTVFADTDGNGTQDGAESGIAGVTVELLDATGITVIATQTTNATGFYGFAGLPAADYIVRVDNSSLPATTTMQTADPDNLVDGQTSLTLAPAQVVTTADFGFQPRGRIGDTVFADDDGDGFQSVGEAGIAGVTVDLVQGTIVLTTTTTDAAGNYVFTDLPDGAYSVEVASASLPLDTRLQTADRDFVLDDQTTVSLVDGSSIDDADFGYQPVASIGDMVFADADGDGTQDPGENGLPGIGVNLRDGSGLIIATTTTDASGTYGFIGLGTGTYTVQIDITGLPANTTTQTADRDASLDNQTQIVLDPGIDRLDADFGYQPLGSIGDFIFEDQNGNGIQDIGDVGIAGVTIELIDSTGATIAAQTTDSTGLYNFGGLAPDTFTIVVVSTTLPASVNLPTADRDSALDNTTTIGLVSGQLVEDADFGYQPLGGIGDRIWADNDGDGSQGATEPGLAGVDVVLLDAGGTQVDMATTNASGDYFFSRLAIGDYTIRVVSSSLPINTTLNTGDPDGGFDSESAISLGASQTIIDQDFGFQPRGSIGDIVFTDVNGSGTQDGTEIGIAGVTVELFDGAGTPLASTVTDGAGHYLFGDLSVGSYEVRVDGRTLPVTTTTNTADPDGVLDSATLVVLLPGEAHETADFGFQPLGAIGSVVWTDLDGDGSQGAGELGIPGITVRLVNGTGSVVATATTSVLGDFLFTDLGAGNYTVRVDPSTLPTNLRTQTGDIDGVLDDETTVALPPGSTNTTPAFGYQPRGVIGDLIFLDAAGNGVLDTGDVGLAGITVNLFDTSGALVASTATDGSGVYGFEGLVAGSYEVRVATATLPPTTTTLTADPDSLLDSVNAVTLAPGAVIDDVDFGYRPDPTVGGVVVSIYADYNGNAIQDGLDPDLAGISVELLDVTSTVVATASTGVDGSVSFLGLLPGNYTTTVDTTTLPADFTNQTEDPDAVRDDAHAVVVIAGTTDSSSVFGYQPLGSISTVVFADADGNGVQNGAEIALSGITVQLHDSVGTLIDTQTTNGAGGYTFTSLAAADYSVRVVDASLPVNIRRQTADPDSLLDSDTALTLGIAEHAGPLVFGYQPLGSVAGTVFGDEDSDALIGVSEPRFNGVVIDLVDGSGTVLDSVSTDVQGDYHFADLVDGVYTVQIDVTTLPATMTVQTADPDGVLDSSTLAAVVGATSSVGNDFGYRPVTPPARGSISSAVWIDLDGDGQTEDGEEPIASAFVELLDGSGTPVSSVTTGVDGSFTFTGLLAGAYTIRVDESTLPVRNQTGDPDAILDSEHTYTLTAGEDAVVDPFGYQPDDPDIAELRGLVFVDEDRDSVRDPGEIAVEGATIILFNDAGIEIARTTTDVAGVYVFSGLPFGSYEAELIMPSGYTLSPENSGPEGSDFDTGRRFEVVLSPSVQSEIGFAGIQQINQPTTTTTAPTTTTTTAPSTGGLAVTGSNSGALVMLGFGLIMVGGIGVGAARRRKSAA